jgi:uncharacterized membrane protein
MFPRSRPSVIALALGGAGLSLCLLLTWWALSGQTDTVIGCGGASGCAEVLGSRWSRVLHLPVALSGALLYGVLIVAILRDDRRLLGAGALALGGSALWFIGLQIGVVRAFCGWCMAAHGVALALAATLLFHLRAAGGEGRGASLTPGFGVRDAGWGWLGLLAAAGLVFVQVFGPAPSTQRITAATGEVTSTVDAQASGPGPKVTFAAGTKTFDCGRLPRLGPASAPTVFVEYFDYTCDACRVMRGHLHALVDQSGGQVAVLLLPAPMERACNPHVPEGTPDHPGACEAARLALAVWSAAPAGFAAVEEALWGASGPDLARAREIAAIHLPGDALAGALADPWIDALIAANAEDVRRFSHPSDKLPKLLLSDRQIAHGLPPGLQEFLRTARAAAGLPPAVGLQHLQSLNDQ